MSTLKDSKVRIGLFLVLFAIIAVSVYSMWSFYCSSTTILGQGMQDGRNSFSPHTIHPPSNGNIYTPNGDMFKETEHTDTKYAAPLILYSILFFGVFTIFYYLFVYKNIIVHKNKKLLVWTILAAGLLLRIAVAPWVGGFPYDINLFKEWATSAAKSLSGFYMNGWSDYPPFFVYILYVVGKIASMQTMNLYFTLLIKLPSILADVATAYIMYRLSLKYLSLEISILLSAFYIFNPAIIINSTFWGQVDSFFTMLIVLAVFTLCEGKIYIATAIFTAAILMKPQGIIYLPVFFFVLISLKNVKRFVIAAVTSIATVLMVIIPFSLRQDPIWIVKLYSKTIGEYPYGSMNAFNFFSLIGGNFKPNTTTLFLLNYHVWGLIAIVIVTLFSWFVYIKGRTTKFASIAALLQISGVFTFSTSMHERYLFPAAALSLLAFIYIKDKRLLWLCAGFSATIFINTFAVLFRTSGSDGLPYSLPLIITSLLNVLFFIYLIKVGWDIAVKKKIFTLK